MDERIYGKVRWYSQEKGYGFLEVIGENRQVFFHVKSMREAGIEEDEVRFGLPVSFVIADNKGREMADAIERDDD